MTAHLPRWAQSRIRLLAVAGAIALAALLSSHAISESSAASARKAPAKPTIVLVHGAWADGSSWSGVIRRLQRRGYTVDAPPNPLRGIASDSAYLASYLKTIQGPVVLAGHSYGGTVITNGAVADPNVKALVYIDAFIPDMGDTLLGLASAKPGSQLANPDPTQVFDFVPFGPGAGETDIYVKRSVFPDAFANGLPARKAADLAARQRPLPVSALQEPSGPPAWKSIPSWSLIGTADHVIPPAEQVAMSKNAGSHMTRVRAPHLSMIARPGAVTEVILEAARSAH